MTRAEILKRFPNASAAFVRANADELSGRRASAADGVSAPVPKHDSGKSLEPVAQGEEKSGGLLGARAFIEFHVFAIQPLDWDNCFTKPLQDLLIEAGLLDGDGWDVLQGRVVPHQVHKKSEQRTEVRIWYY